MLPTLEHNQKVYVEISNPEHGGRGWELGTTLWSPVYNRGGVKSWQLMELVNTGDMVIHLVKLETNYHWTGLSIVSSKVNIVDDEPPSPARWGGMSPYQRITLEKYTELDSPPPISLFFRQYEDKLKAIHTQSFFYILYGDQNELRVAHRYFASCSLELYNLFNDFSNLHDFNPNLENQYVQIPTDNEPSCPDYSAPGRIMTIVSRIIRDTRLVRDLKKEYEWKCQICDIKFLLPSGRFYAEGHHLQPLGGTHGGPDVADNIVILCPNHHAEFDFGSIAIDPTSLKTTHISKKNPYHMKELAYQRGDLANKFIEYHYEHLFNK
tara:strand:- start:109 stop:1077 length:969 start_codon:yes stop_codon:yes gene_type:complete